MRVKQQTRRDEGSIIKVPVCFFSIFSIKTCLYVCRALGVVTGAENPRWQIVGKTKMGKEEDALYKEGKPKKGGGWGNEDLYYVYRYITLATSQGSCCGRSKCSLDRLLVSLLGLEKQTKDDRKTVYLFSGLSHNRWDALKRIPYNRIARYGETNRRNSTFIIPLFFFWNVNFKSSFRITLNPQHLCTRAL